MSETPDEVAADKPPLHVELLASLEQDKARAEERIRIVGELVSEQERLGEQLVAIRDLAEKSMAEAETSQARTLELTTALEARDTEVSELEEQLERQSSRVVELEESLQKQALRVTELERDLEDRKLRIGELEATLKMLAEADEKE